MAILFAITLIGLLLFAYIDIWYLIRFFASLYLGKRQAKKQGDYYTRDDLLEESTTYSIVLPSDIDGFLHMNNSKYMKEYDIARINMAARLGFLDIVQKHRGSFFAMNAGNIKYRRSMKLFQRFTIKTKVIAWDNDSFYIEQRTVTPNGFITSILLSKFVVKGISIEQCLAELCGKDKVPQSPEFSPELESWMTSLEYSSKRLRIESGLLSQTNNSSNSLLRSSSVVREIGALSLTR